VDLSNLRIEFEVSLIDEMMQNLELDVKSFTWDGFKLNIRYTENSGSHQTFCDRNDLIEYIPELNFWKKIIEKKSETDLVF